MKLLSGRKGRNLFSLFFLAVFLYAAFFTGGEALHKKKRTTTRLLMGTLVSITTWAVAEDKERLAVGEAFAEMARIESFMSSHRADSPVARINASGLEEPQPVPQELARLLGEALKIQKITQGAFDPGLGKLIGLWGFSKDEPATQPPKKEAIAAWSVDFHAGGGVELAMEESGKQNLVRLTNPATGLDLGGIAKGYAIDRAIEQLKKSGIDNALVNAGGDLRGIGHKGGKPWRVGIQHPRDAKRIIATSQWPNRSDSDMAMVTSGDYERFFVHEGEKYHHILNPKNGYPAQSGLLSVSVQAGNATLADGLTTAFFVMGEQPSRELVKKMPGVEILLVRKDESYWKSGGFKGRWQGKP